ncbi:MAG: proton-conducting transporter membrane subunit [Phycisphaerae bacterium]
MLELLDSYALRVMVVLPMFGAVFAAVVTPPHVRGRNNGSGQLARFNAASFSIATAFVTAIAGVRYITGSDLARVHDWLRLGLGLDLSLGMDPVSLLFAAGVAIVTPAAVLASSRQLAGAGRGHFSWLLLTEGTLLGAILSRDLLLTTIFAEAAVVSAFFCLRPGRLPSPYRNHRLGLQMLASALWLGGVLHWGWTHFDQTGVLSFAYADLLHLRLEGLPAAIITPALTAALLIKTACPPGNLWLRSALHSAPAGGAILMLAGVTKLGLYLGIVVLTPAILPLLGSIGAWASVLLGLGVVYAALMCYRQRTFLDALSWSTALVAALGLAGVASGTAMGLSGTAVLAIAHAIGVAGVLLAGVQAVPGLTSASLEDVGGLGRLRPLLAAGVALWLASMVAVPGMGGFVGASMVIGSHMQAVRAGQLDWIAATILAGFGLAVHTAYMLVLGARVMVRRRDPHTTRPLGSLPGPIHSRVRATMLLTVLLAVTFLVGLRADVFEPELSASHSKLLSRLGRLEHYDGHYGAATVTGPLSAVLMWAGVLVAGVAGALALREKRLGRLMVWLLVADASAVLLAVSSGGGPHATSFLTGGSALAMGAAGLTVVHGLGLVLAMGYVSRTREGEFRSVEHLAGLGSSHPGAALALGVLLWSTAGLPVTAGMIRRYSIAGAAVWSGWTPVSLTWLVVRCMAAVAAVRMVAALLRPAGIDVLPTDPMPGLRGQLWRVAITVIVVAIVILGVLPELVLDPLMQQ